MSNQFDWVKPDMRKASANFDRVISGRTTSFVSRFVPATLCLGLALIQPTAAASKFSYQDSIPGVTTYEDFKRTILDPNAEKLNASSSFDFAKCESADSSGVTQCTVDLREHGGHLAFYYFFEGTLLKVSAIYPGKQISSLLHAVEAKYGRPMSVTPMEYRNDVGADFPFKTYQWNRSGSQMWIDEIDASDPGSCDFNISDDRLRERANAKGSEKIKI